MKRKVKKVEHPAETSEDRAEQSRDVAHGQAGESVTIRGEPPTADRSVLYCRDAELAFDGQHVDLVVPGAARQSLPIGWCVRVAVQPLPETRTLQLVLHFAPGRPGAEGAMESPVLVVLRLFVDEPSVRDAEMMVERLTRRAPWLARPRVQDEVYGLVGGEAPQAIPGAGARTLAMPEPAPGRPASAEARPAVWYATQNGEWAYFLPMPGTVEVRDDLVGWARNLGSDHAAGP